MNKESVEIESNSDNFITIKKKIHDVLTVNKLSNSDIIENVNANYKKKEIQNYRKLIPNLLIFTCLIV